MSRSNLTLKQAQLQLNYAAGALALFVRGALKLWLLTVEELPRRAQHPPTAATTHLVQAALQEATWSVRPYEFPRRVAWLQKHLPGIITAMQDSVSSQMHTIGRRVDILKSLASQQPSDAQLLARLVSERNTYVLLEVLSLVFLIVLPVEALCSDLSCQAQARKDEQQAKRSKQHQRLQQGTEMIRKVASSLEQRASIRMALIKQKEQTYLTLHNLDMSLSTAPSKFRDLMHNAVYLTGEASIVWLHLVNHLPPAHIGTVLFLEHVDWGFLDVYIHLDPTANARLKTLVCEVFASELFTTFWGRQPCVAQLLLRYMGFTAERLRNEGKATGLSASERKILLAVLTASEASIGVQSKSGLGYFCDLPDDSQALRSSNSASNSNSATDISQNPGDGSLASTPCSSTESQKHDDSLGDMQALLKLMYGCTVQSG